MTNRWWYAVAGALAVVALVLAAVIALGVADNLEGAGVDRVGSDGTVSIQSGKQLAVYVQEGDVRPSTCTATPDNGGAPVRLGSPAASLIINGWERVALSPRDTAAGDYTLRCEPGSDTGQEPSALGAGNNPEIAGAVGRVLSALAVGGIGVVVAMVIAIVTAVRRHKQRRPAPRGR